MALLLMAQSRAASVDVLYLHGASLSRLAISTSFVLIRAPCARLLELCGSRPETRPRMSLCCTYRETRDPVSRNETRPERVPRVSKRNETRPERVPRVSLGKPMRRTSRYEKRPYRCYRGHLGVSFDIGTSCYQSTVFEIRYIERKCAPTRLLL